MALPSLLLASALAGAGSPPPLPLETAEAEVLERWDAAAALDARPSGPVEVRDRAALAWLRAALGPGLPANPFRRGTPDHREAEAVRALLQAAPERRAALLQALRPLRAGSRAALWRWGQALVRQGAMPRALRHAWEDLLLEGGPALLRGFALRHALCFALAEGDAARFAALRERYGEGADDVFGQVQPAFALLGAPAPRLRLWRLPGLEEDARPLSELGARLAWDGQDRWVTFDFDSPVTAALLDPDGNYPMLKDRLHASWTARPLRRGLHYWAQMAWGLLTGALQGMGLG